ncbi:MAG: response regulator transcription factor [Nocardioides sp.]|nr:response regulator transcription factor [Nocardioidaceae bacterium]MCB8956952.1 response regulator transcription factor [Nocardioides sp.]
MSPQEVCTKGLAAMLSEHPHRSQVTDVEDAEVVLYDVLGVHRTNGSDLEAIVGEDGPVVVAVSRDLRPDLRARALAAGAHGWISMSVDSHQLIDAVEAAAQGQDLPGRTDRLGSEVGLTPREVEVLSLIAQGMSNLEIAEGLYLSINSVKTYIRSAYAKIGATSRSRAVAWCLQHGFSPPAEREAGE